MLEALAVVAVFAVGTTAQAESCEQQWWADSARFVDQATPDYKTLLAEWQAREPDCKGTGIYEARLATIFTMLEQPAKAHKTLQSLKNVPEPYKDDVALARILAEHQELVIAGKTEVSSLENVEAKYISFVEQYPTSLEGRALLGGLETVLGKHREAIHHLARATHSKTPGQLHGVFRNLTISLAHVGKYEEAYRAAGKTIEFRKESMADPWFMCAAARAQVGLGRLDDAETTLGVLITKTPDFEADREYQETLRLLVEAKQRLKDPKK
jgi:tetratricopeptide (TPR) repeat protein